MDNAITNVKQHAKSTRGFSLAEVLMVVAILIILLAIAVPNLIGMVKNLRQTELDAKAETIYVTAQNQMSKLYASGYESVFLPTNASGCINYIQDDPSDYGEVTSVEPTEELVYITSADLGNENSAAHKLFEDVSIDEELLGNSWVIEYSFNTGTIYAVYYGGPALLNSGVKIVGNGDLYKGGYVDSYSQYNLLRSLDKRWVDALVGYHGGNDGSSSGGSYNLDPTVDVVDGEELVANITCRVPSGVDSSEKLVFKVTVSDNQGNSYVKYYTYYDAAYSTGGYDLDYQSVTKVGRKYTLDLTLDSLNTVNGASQRFNDLYGSNSGHDASKKESVSIKSTILECGTAITVSVTALCPDNLEVKEGSNSDSANSLFAPESTSTTANIVYGRHLQNLDSSSNVISTITAAQQCNDLALADTTDSKSWYNVYANANFYNGLTASGAPNFKPISNSNLTSFQGSNGTTQYRISDLEEKSSTQSLGLFEQIDLSDSKTVSLSNIILTGFKADAGSSNAAGSLVGYVHGSGTLNVSGTQSYLTSSDVSSTGSADAWITGSNAGGLIGSVGDSATVNLNTSSASCVVGSSSTSSTGGLVGTADGGTVTATECYADCYLNGKMIGGLVGSSSASVTLTDCYSAGFISNSTECAGLVDGDANMTRCYTISSLYGTNNITYRTAKTGTANQVFYNEGARGINEAENDGTKQVGGMALSDLADGESNAFTSNTASSEPYNLWNQGLTTYNYPQLSKLTHFGDWAATFQKGALVYYEKYLDGTYAFEGANVTSTLVTSGVVVGDGYGVVYNENDVPTSEQLSQVTITVGGTDYKLAGSYYEVTSDGVTYRVYPFDAGVNNPSAAVSGFYEKAIIKGASASDSSDAYYFNPHFAKTVKYLQDASAPAPTITSDTNIYVRTARQLHNLSLYYDGYADVTQPATFVQERNIDYTEYEWTNFANCAAVSSQAPIAGGDKPFVAVYNGNGYWITNVSFTTEQGLYVGMFGRNASTVENVVLRASYNKDSDSNFVVSRTGTIQSNQVVRMGVLVGLNEAKGTVSNCAVSGYYIAGAGGTIHAYENSYLRGGGLVGENNGSITSCSADTPTMRLSSTFAYVKLGGFVGLNAGTINNSYALGHIEVVYARSGNVVIGGFAGGNEGAVSGSYCATALTSSGDSTVSYGFGPVGGLVTGCEYLNNGTYSYIGNMYAFSSELSSGSSETYSGLYVDSTSASAAAASYNFNNTKTSTSRYPFRAVVRDANGNLVHYGDWIDDENMGSLGIFYWELEEYGTNNGYHFTYLGSNAGSAIGNTNLCVSHDDGGEITEYGYGYYEVNEGAVTSLEASGSTINGSSTWSSSDANAKYNTEASAALQEQMSQAQTGKTYYFYAFTTRTADEAGTSDYICMNGTEANSTWTLSYRLSKESSTMQYYQFTLCPFFANSMCYDGYSESKSGSLTAPTSLLVTARDGSVIDFTKTPGLTTTEDKGNPYEIRSCTQLQYINWKADCTSASEYSSFVHTYKDTASEYSGADTASAHDFPYECGYAGDSSTGQKCYTQSHDMTNLQSDGTVKKFYPLGKGGRSFKEDYNGYSYRINDINIEESVSTYVGLFGEAGGGTKLQNIILTADTDDDGNSLGKVISKYVASEYKEPAVGALVGMVWVGSTQASQITIKNCSASGYTVGYEGTISYSSFDRYTSVGGLVGSMFSGTLENCTAANDVEVNQTVSSSVSTYPPQYLGGLVGTAGVANNGGSSKASTVRNCYSGGTLTPDTKSTKARYTCGGLIGNGSGSPSVVGSGQTTNTTIENSYSYCKVPYSNNNGSDETKSTGYLYVVGGMSIPDTAYYYDSTGTDADSHARTYAEMTDGTLLTELGGTPGKGGTSTEFAGYHMVTTVEGASEVAIDGKYSYPVNSALEGKNYPFPAIIEQKDLIYSTSSSAKYVYVHYGDWPISGPYWENGRDSLDILADKEADESWAYKTFTLYSNGADLSGLQASDIKFSVNGEAVDDVASVDSITNNGDGSYSVKIKAKKASMCTVTMQKDGYSASFVLEITANINANVFLDAEFTLPVSTMYINVGKKSNVYLQALAGDVDYSKATNLKWSVDFVDEDQKDYLECTAKAKNQWQIERMSRGDVMMKATATYNYNGTDYTCTVFFTVSLTDRVGLRYETKDSTDTTVTAYNEATVKSTDEGTILGTSRTFDSGTEKPPSYSGSNIYLYTPSEAELFSNGDLSVDSIIVTYNGATDTIDGDNGVANVGGKNIFVDFSGACVTDTSAGYQYIPGRVYCQSWDSGDEPISGVSINVILSKEGSTAKYSLSGDLSQVAPQKLTTLQYLSGCSCPQVNRVVVTGDKVTLPEPSDLEFVWRGYTFTHWDVQGSSYQPGDVLDTSSMGNSSVNVTANWVLSKYNVYVDPNGGSVKFVANGQTYTEKFLAKTDSFMPTIDNGVQLQDAYREGYTFVGWFDATSGEQYAENGSASWSEVKPDHDTTVVAKWGHNVTYNFQTDSSVTVTMDGKQYTSGSAVVAKEADVSYELPTPTRSDNRAFEGWNTEPDGSGTSYKAGSAITISADTTLYAQWSKGHEVKLVSGKSGTAAFQSYAECIADGATGFSIDVSSKFSNEGYELDGFYAKEDDDTGFADCTKVLDASGKPVAEVSGYTEKTTDGYVFKLDDDVTLYALWKKQQGEKFVLTDTLESGETYVIATDVFNSSKVRALGANSNGSGQNNANYDIESLSSGYYYGCAGGFKAATQTIPSVSYDLSKWAFTEDGALQNKAYSYYLVFNSTGSGWSLKLDASSATLNFAYDTSSHSVYGKNTGGTTMYFRSSGNSGSNFVAYSSVQSNSVYIYKYTPIYELSWAYKYKVDYDSDGGSTVDSQTVTPDEDGNASVTLSAAPTKSGYRFDGWKDSSGTTYKAGSTITITGDLALTAQWKESSTLTLSSVKGSSSQAFPEGSTVSTSAVLTDGTTTYQKPSYSGWTLEGWYTTNSGTGGTKVLTADGKLVSAEAGAGYVENGEVSLGGSDKTLYAKWSRKGYTSATSFTSGESYLVTSSNYAILQNGNNSNVGSESLSSTYLSGTAYLSSGASVSLEDYAFYDVPDECDWEAASTGGSSSLVNNGYYLYRYSSGGPRPSYYLRSSSNSMIWTYSSSKMYYKNDNSYYYISCSNGSFGINTNNGATITLYQLTTVYQYD